MHLIILTLKIFTAKRRNVFVHYLIMSLFVCKYILDPVVGSQDLKCLTCKHSYKEHEPLTRKCIGVVILNKVLYIYIYDRKDVYAGDSLHLIIVIVESK